jgi:hypothetical protein
MRSSTSLLLVYVLGSLALSSRASASDNLMPMCYDFHPPNLSFGSIDVDYADSILFVKADDSVGEAFLIDTPRKYFLTTRHDRKPKWHLK